MSPRDHSERNTARKYEEVTGRGKLLLARWFDILRQLGWLPYVAISLAMVAGGAINEAVAGHSRRPRLAIALAAVAGCAVAFRRCLRRAPIALLILPPLGVSLFGSMHGWALVIGATLLVALVAFGARSTRPSQMRFRLRTSRRVRQLGAVDRYRECRAHLPHPRVAEPTDPIREKRDRDAFDGVEVDRSLTGNRIVTGFE